MKQFDLLSDTLAPLMEKLDAEEKKKVAGALGRLKSSIARQETSYRLALDNRVAVHALLRKTSNDLIRRYQTLFEYSGTAMVIVDADGTISLANTVMEKMLGYTREEVEKRRNFGEFIPKDALELMALYHRRRLDGDGTVPHVYEARLLHKDGQVLDVIVNAALLPGEKQVLVSILDITGRKKAEDELFISRQMLQRVLDSIPVRVFWKDRDSVFLGANRAFARDAGYSDAGELIGKTDFDTAFAPSAGAHEAADRQVMETGHAKIMCEELLKKTDGSTVWISTSKVPLMSKTGDVTGVLGTYEDITERKVLEEESNYYTMELQRYAAILHHTNDKLNLMNSITRHDILNQLTILKGCLDMMQARFPDPSLQKYISHQVRSAGTIQDLILFTKDYQEIGVQSPCWFDLKKGILATEKSLHLSAISLDITFDNLEVYADPLIGKVIYTLFDNAINHGKTVSRIEFSLCRENGNLVITCTDNGVGVPAEHKEEIFQRKYFMHTGFGLFLSREILAITGLSIHETGEPGKGARFEITVPQGGYRFTGGGSPPV
jgi:PAS domain S-box-containing protein